MGRGKADQNLGKTKTGSEVSRVPRGYRLENAKSRQNYENQEGVTKKKRGERSQRTKAQSA